MNAPPRWVSKRALLLLHLESLAEFGGSQGPVDEGLLDSALARAQNAWAYSDSTSIAELAAQYGYGIVKNHPFIDGNKRAAFLAIGIFLALNGWRLKADKADAVQTIMSAAAGTLDEHGLAAWIQKFIEPA